MNVIGGEEPGRFAIHAVNPFSFGVRHGPEVRLRSIKLYFQMLVSPFTVRLTNTVFPGSA